MAAGASGLIRFQISACATASTFHADSVVRTSRCAPPSSSRPWTTRLMKLSWWRMSAPSGRHVPETLREVGGAGRLAVASTHRVHRSPQRRRGGSDIAEVGAASRSSFANPVSSAASPCSSGRSWIPLEGRHHGHDGRPVELLEPRQRQLDEPLLRALHPHANRNLLGWAARRTRAPRRPAPQRPPPPRSTRPPAPPRAPPAPRRGPPCGAPAGPPTPAPRPRRRRAVRGGFPRRRRRDR